MGNEGQRGRGAARVGCAHHKSEVKHGMTKRKNRDNTH